MFGTILLAQGGQSKFPKICSEAATFDSTEMQAEGGHRAIYKVCFSKNDLVVELVQDT